MWLLWHCLVLSLLVVVTYIVGRVLLAGLAVLVGPGNATAAVLALGLVALLAVLRMRGRHG